MTKEQIEREANEFAEREYEVNSIDRDALSKGFFHGAQWCINSVWHDVSERPKFLRKEECVSFLLLRKNGGCDWFLLSKCDWDDFMDTGKFVKWAYIDDFLPERKEETE